MHQEEGTTSVFSGDFAGQDGLAGGVFLGYGITHQKWHFAIEADVETSGADWKHVREPNGRNFSVEKKGSYGLAGRVGYQLDNGSLVYFRAGKVKSKFNTDWTKGNNSEADIERDDNVWGNRFGVGTELPLTDHVSVRFDYSYTDYESYHFTTAHGKPDTMKFDNDEALFRVGISVNF